MSAFMQFFCERKRYEFHAKYCVFGINIQ